MELHNQAIKLINQYGFQYRGTCTCVGSRTEKYKYGNYTLYYHRKKQVFKLKEKHTYVTGQLSTTELETELKKYLQAS